MEEHDGGEFICDVMLLASQQTRAIDDARNVSSGDTYRISDASDVNVSEEKPLEYSPSQSEDPEAKRRADAVERRLKHSAQRGIGDTSRISNANDVKWGEEEPIGAANRDRLRRDLEKSRQLAADKKRSQQSSSSVSEHNYPCPGHNLASIDVAWA